MTSHQHLEVFARWTSVPSKWAFVMLFQKEHEVDTLFVFNLEYTWIYFCFLILTYSTSGRKG